MEASMKSYVNDIDHVVDQIGDRVTLLGNIDPVRILQDGSDDELRAAMKHQVAAGSRGRGFLFCTGSPVTPATPLARVQKYLKLGRSLK